MQSSYEKSPLTEISGLFSVSKKTRRVFHPQAAIFFADLVIQESDEVRQAQPIGTDHQMPLTPMAGIADSR
jgi:hypothetical protein